MSNSAIDSDKRQQIMIAESWQTLGESAISRDAAYDSFLRLILHRRELARKYLREENDDNKQYLFEMINRINEQIKQILGL